LACLFSGVLVVGVTSLPLSFLFLQPPLFLASALRDVVSPMGRGGSPLGSLGMSAENINESQSFPSHLNSSTINNLINEIWDKFFFGWFASAWTLSTIPPRLWCKKKGKFKGLFPVKCINNLM
jgi:hypothetical protein